MLVVAAPHSKCISRERDCDLVAKQVTESLIKKARAAGIKTIGCMANKPRIYVDNNRKGSESSDFRKDLHEVLRQDGLFIEVHSHPNVKRFNGKKMTIFNLPRNKDVGRKLFNFLKLNGFYVGIEPGEPVMDIQQNYKGLMLEFNETSTIDDKLLDKIIEFVQMTKPAPMYGGSLNFYKKIFKESCTLCVCIFCIILIILIIYLLFQIIPQIIPHGIIRY